MFFLFLFLACQSLFRNVCPVPGTVLISGVIAMNKTEEKVSVFIELTFGVRRRRGTGNKYQVVMNAMEKNQTGLDRMVGDGCYFRHLGKASLVVLE